MERRGQTGWEPCLICPRHGAETTEVDQKGKKKKKSAVIKACSFCLKNKKGGTLTRQNF